MARRWFLNADNEIVGLSDNDLFPVPADQTSVLDSVIRAVDPPGAEGRIQSGGIWDGSEYTAPVGGGILIPFYPDPATELGRGQIVLLALHDQLEAWRYGVLEVSHQKPLIDTQRALQFLPMAHWAAYVVAAMWRNGDLTIAQVEAWCMRMAMGSADSSNVQEYYENAHALEDTDIPQEACAWVNPEDAVAVNADMARQLSTNAQNTVLTADGVAGEGYFTMQVVELTHVTFGGGDWIENII